MAGANSIFYGDQLLTTANPQAARDRRLLGRLGMSPVEAPRQESEQTQLHADSRACRR